MASPFTVFRKNQKVLLAVTGILAMIAFVFLGTCTQSSEPTQAFENPTVVSWKYGDITEYDMENRVSMRRILNQFIAGARTLAGAPRDTQPFFDLNEDNIVRTMVLARRGRELGLVVSDDMVNQFLQVVTNDRVRPAELEQIIASFKMSNQRVTAKQIFDALREELLAERTSLLFLDAMGGERRHYLQFLPPLDTPAQRWDHFRRLERQATVQVLPVPVAEFTEEVGKPSEEELRALFEKHKDQFASPEFPEPGFRQPYRARFQYFKADIDELVTAEMKQIPEKEVRDYYEKNKDTQFKKSTLSPLDEKDTKTKDGKDAATGDDKSEPEKSETEKSASKDSDAKTPDDAKKAENKDNAGQVKGDDSQDDPAKAKPNYEKAAGNNKPAAADKEAGASDKSVRINPPSPFRWAAFQDEKQPKDKAAPATPKQETAGETQPTAGSEKTAKSADTGKKAAPAGDKGDSTDATKQDSDQASKGAGADAQPATTDTAKEPATTEAAKTEAAKTEAAKSEAAKSEAAAPEPIEYRPLEQVEEEIRRNLARERVQKQVDEKLEKLRAEMNRYATSMSSWRRAAAKDPNEPKPKPFELEALAEKHGVKAFTTAFLSILDAQTNDKLDIASSTDMNPRSPTFFYQWPQIVFRPGNLFKPLTTRAPAGASFLSWKIEEREGHIPEFAEVRTEVLEAWKRDKARALARKKAEEYADLVRQAKRPMAEVFAEDDNLPVKEVGPFSWLTRPNVPMGMMQQLPPIQYPRVDGVELPREEFMETTFNLQPGEVGVALNGAKAVAYVIQVVKFEPSDAVLEQEFLVRARDYERYRAAGGVVAAQAQSDWMDSLLAEYAVDWRRPPDMRLAGQE